MRTSRRQDEKTPIPTPASHDHHHGLAQARRLARSAGAPQEVMRQQVEAFLQFARQSLMTHFRDEEQILLPALEPYLDIASDAQCQRLLQEHRQMWAQIEALQRALSDGNLSAETMLELANNLAKHIRFEERELFPWVESVLPEEAMQLLGARLRPQQD